MPDKLYVKKEFKRYHGYKLNLKNPRSLSEKMQWLKFYDRSPLLTTYADKYAVRPYIKEKIGEQYLVPLLYQTTTISDIIPKNLPNEPFIIKTNHDSGSHFIVYDKHDVDWQAIRKKFKKSLKTNFYPNGREWQYKNIKPRIIVEKLILDDQNNIPKDYKVHCFNGKVIFTQVDFDRATSHKRNLYDPEWNWINVKLAHGNGPIEKKPPMMDQMQELAKKLASGFDYVRVDFYTFGNKIYFSELTFHPGSGWEVFSPQEFDRQLGDRLILTNFQK